VYVVLGRFVEQRPPTELAGRKPIAELAVGLAIGAGLFTLTIGLIALGGGYRVVSIASPWNLVPPLGMALVSGVVEELLMRGILFRLLEELLGSWAALGLSAALFGLAHIGNPNATWFGALAIAVEAGTLLGAAYMTTRRLWLAIGIHAAWNWTQGAVFGVAVSGHAMKGWLVGEPRGPAWLSGGEFGAEASVVAMLVCATAAYLLLQRTLRTSPAIAPAWSRGRRERAAAA
jgi:membrane protease YdiL (CAAX protease family)